MWFKRHGLWLNRMDWGRVMGNRARRDHVREREAWRKGDAGRLGKSRCLRKEACPEEFC